MRPAYTTLVIPAGSISSPYEAALGATFEALPMEVRRAHLAPLVAAGTFDVEHGSHWFAPMLVRLLKLPGAGRARRVQLEVTAHRQELFWARRIGDVFLRTRQRAVGSKIAERSGLGTIVFDLTAQDGALVYQQSEFRVAGVPIPQLVAPVVRARVTAASGGWHVEVHVAWRGHLICRYAGLMAAA